METWLVDIAHSGFRLPVLAWPFGTVLGPLHRSLQRPRRAGQCFEILYPFSWLDCHQDTS